MHAMSSRRIGLALAAAIALGPALARAEDDATKGGASPLQAATQPAPVPSPYAYGNGDEAPVAPSAGIELGFGAAIPTLHTTPLQAQLRLGASFHLPRSWSLVVAGQSGITFALNTGSADPYYGYLIRVPAELVVEAIDGLLVSYRHRRYVNVHYAVVGGPQFMLAATCLRGNCDYIAPSVAFGVGPRLGLSYAAKSRNSVGVFVTWHNDFASCPVGSPSHCTSWISTLIWTLGWTLF